VLFDAFCQGVEELFDLWAIAFPLRSVMIRREDRLHRFELSDGKRGFAGIERFERPEDRNLFGIDGR
jgi:hypothetical protein